ncbi:MAG: DNA repair exonuclease [Clostridia bacterium]|nr:DNA repair exonuclease [Clostridia bacterium]
MIRFIHAADMHFDSPFAGLPQSVARVRKEEQKRTFMRIIEATREKKADMLLLAGDIFDSGFVSRDTVSFLKQCFSEIEDTAVFVVPGNHDFLHADSPYKTVDFGRNVHIFGEEPETYQVREATVYGFGFSQRYISESILPRVGMHQEEGPGILLVHGEVGYESDYHPISVGAIAESGLSYVALGHIHDYSGILYAGETAYAYPGVPEKRHFDEAGIGGYIYGEIDGERANYEFVPVGQRDNVTIHVDISGVSSLDAVEDKIRNLLEKQNLYKVVLQGEVPPTMFIDTKALAKRLEGDCLYIKIKDETAPMREEEASLLEKLFVARLSERDDDAAKEAMRLGLEALRRQKR